MTSSPSSLNVAIIGAGIAGCAAAAFAREEFPSARISVFERENSVGGRIQTIEFRGLTIEAGASFFHSSNRLLMGLAASLGLPLRERNRLMGDASAPVGVWNGKTFEPVLHRVKFISALQLALRYGPSLPRLRRLAQRALVRWERVYALQDAKTSFASPRELVDALDLLSLTNRSTYDYLASEHVSDEIVAEIVNSVSRSIYNQDASMNAFAGMVALLGTGMAGGRAFSVVGGNSILCERLLYRADAQLFTRRAIVSVTADSGSEQVRVVDERGAVEKVDAVIIAAPDAIAQRLLDSERSQRIVTTEGTRMTHVICVAGHLSAGYFGAAHWRQVPAVVLTTESKDIPFSTLIRTVSPENADTHVYKIQSRDALPAELLSSLFSRIDDVIARVWEAYPTLNPAPRSGSFRIAARVFHTGALEPYVSTLETSVVAARNVVTLMRQEFRP